jgi:hypothetical protein
MQVKIKPGGLVMVLVTIALLLIIVSQMGRSGQDGTGAVAVPRLGGTQGALKQTAPPESSPNRETNPGTLSPSPLPQAVPGTSAEDSIANQRRK